VFDRLIQGVCGWLDVEGWWRRVCVRRWRVIETGRSITYVGEYALWDPRRGRGLKVRGRVVEWPGLGTDVYLYDPPDTLRHHQHGTCLQLLRPGGKWFKLHWTRPARTFAASKEYVEQMLWEAHHPHV